MSKTVRRGRVRLQPYVDGALAERLDQFCAATDVTVSAVVVAAIRQYLDGTSDATLVLRRLDRLGRALARNHRDVELLSEAFAVFVRVWFAHTPVIPESGKKLRAGERRDPLPAVRRARRRTIFRRPPLPRRLAARSDRRRRRARRGGRIRRNGTPQKRAGWIPTVRRPTPFQRGFRHRNGRHPRSGTWRREGRLRRWPRHPRT